MLFVVKPLYTPDNDQGTAVSIQAWYGLLPVCSTPGTSTCVLCSLEWAVGSLTCTGWPNRAARVHEGVGSDIHMAASTEVLNTLFGEDYYTDNATNYVDFSEPCIPPKQNPLEWWRTSEQRFKKLSVPAREFLNTCYIRACVEGVLNSRTTCLPEQEWLDRWHSKLQSIAP